MHCPKRHQATLLAAGMAMACIAPRTAFAQVRCTMPNGVVIEQRLADTCPAGATKGERFDGTPIAITIPTPPKPAAPSPPREPAPQPQAKAAPTVTAYDDAHAICTILLGTNNATSCEVDSNMFSTSVIDVTLPAGARAATLLCQEIKTTFRQADRPIVQRSANWEIRFFSPYGSAGRPIARCVL